MRASRSQFPPKHRLSQEWRRALQLLANVPRGTTEGPFFPELLKGRGFAYVALAATWNVLLSPALHLTVPTRSSWLCYNGGLPNLPHNNVPS
jgi:hypothetical protein